MNETAEPTEPDDEHATENTDDGAAGTLDKPRAEDEGGDNADDTVPDA